MILIAAFTDKVTCVTFYLHISNNFSISKIISN
ncbi:unnamed protein product [Acanthoscelides obtectus]|uniref:Uncharacterized protein n=1 Tax=Acanthoscelides obtectus TaxID=200917 RepID=A0A9P0MHR5_ACAOB|nr:unnamed protein product [Acanthoscelides obtectus]CAK1643949.1 hypothetical protein AOBTE_LOCUS13736 [Acanthoscelides obtectus]